MREFRRVAELREHDSHVAVLHRPRAVAAGEVGGGGARRSRECVRAAGRARVGAAQPRLRARAAGPLRRGADGARRGGAARRREGSAHPDVGRRRRAAHGRRGGAPIRRCRSARPLFGTRPPTPAWFHYAALTAALARRARSRASRCCRRGSRRIRTRRRCTTTSRRCTSGAASYPEALQAAERGVLEDAGLAQLHKNLGDCHYRAARYDDALECVPARREAQPAARRRRVSQAGQHPLQAAGARRGGAVLGAGARARSRATRSCARTSTRCGRSCDRRTTSPTPRFTALTAKIARDRGFGCASYKDKCLRRRIAVRMRARGVHTYARLRARARQRPARVRQAARRADDQRHEAVPELGDVHACCASRSCRRCGRSRDPVINVWSAGCSSGEEPYSLAALFHTTPTRRGTPAHGRARVRVLGSDIDARSLEAAERGAFEESDFSRDAARAAPALLRPDAAVHDRRPRCAAWCASSDATCSPRRRRRAAPSHLLSQRADLLRSRDAGASLPEVPRRARARRDSSCWGRSRRCSAPHALASRPSTAASASSGRCEHASSQTFASRSPTTRSGVATTSSPRSGWARASPSRSTTADTRTGGLAHILLPSMAMSRETSNPAKFPETIVPIMLAEMRALGVASTRASAPRSPAARACSASS